MNNMAVKRATLTLFAVSYYMLYAILLVVLEPNLPVKLLLMAVFVFIAYGVELFFTIGTEEKPARFKTIDFDTFGMSMPMIIYLLFGIFNFRELRGTLLMTALTAFMTLFVGGILDAAAGRSRTGNDNDDDDNDDNDGKGE